MEGDAMREIKFRAWDGYGFDEHILCAGQEVYFQADTECIEQFTGLKDKNGREIYEGDIVNIAEHSEEWGDSDNSYENNCEECTMEIIFCEGAFYIKGDRNLSDGIDQWSQADAPIYTICEVIGNIHENPELLA
jgi:uncharacterized phage protein (TIGR01671 family)